MKIFIASDHKGIKERDELYNYLKGNELDVEKSKIINNDTDDYPDFAFDVCKNVLESSGLGILVCGTGIGMSIAANKVKGIRCARCLSVDDASLSKNHNGANVIALDAKTDINVLKQMVDAFITTKSATEERHLRRINKVIKIENGEYNEL